MKVRVRARVRACVCMCVCASLHAHVHLFLGVRVWGRKQTHYRINLADPSLWWFEHLREPAPHLLLHVCLPCRSLRASCAQPLAVVWAQAHNPLRQQAS